MIPCTICRKSAKYAAQETHYPYCGRHRPPFWTSMDFVEMYLKSFKDGRWEEWLRKHGQPEE